MKGGNFLASAASFLVRRTFLRGQNFFGDAIEQTHDATRDSSQQAHPSRYSPKCSTEVMAGTQRLFNWTPPAITPRLQA